MTDFERLFYIERVKNTPAAKLIEEFAAYKAVSRFRIFEAEANIIAEELRRRIEGDGEEIVFDQSEIIEGCTVQILTNSRTGETSVGWWRGKKEDMPTCESD